MDHLVAVVGDLDAAASAYERLGLTLTSPTRHTGLGTENRVFFVGASAAQSFYLELLAIRFTQTEAPAGNIDLDFAGGGTIRLGVECLEARLQDLGAAWAAKATPEHSA